MKIIVIPNFGYTERDHKRFGVEYLQDSGIDTYVMDVTSVLHPGKQEKIKIDYFRCKNYIELFALEEVLNFVKQLNSDDYILFYIADSKFLNLLKKNTSAKFITYVGGSIPSSTTFCNFYDKLKFYAKKIIKNFLKKYKIENFNTDFFISGSPKDEKIFPFLIGPNTKLVKSNSRDYNLCLGTNPFFYEKKYCVYLDTDVIDAADYTILDMDVKTNKELYFKTLIGFFKWIEDHFKIEVIISAHPSSRIYKDKKEIEGIKIIHGQSNSLVKGSEFVINEGTTAISYAIFFNKPLIFFTFREIDFFYKYVCAFAKELNKHIINVDDLDLKLFQQELHNVDKFNYYKFTYLTYDDTKEDTFGMLKREILENELNARR